MPRRSVSITAMMVCVFSCSLVPVHAMHHMKLKPLHLANRQDSNRPFKVTNYCPVDIYPAVETQAGTGPGFGGFHAVPGNTTNFTVSADWQGRIWARTNCSFNTNGTGPETPGGLNGTGKACLTGDCGGIVNCKGSVSAITLFKS
jgi:beta-mannosidase